jgi:hypothetical protein
VALRQRESPPDLGVAPHARQQRGGELGERAERRGAQEEVRVRARERRGRLRLELGLGDPELARERAVQLHLLAEDRLGEAGEAAHRREIRRPRRTEREHSRVVDEEEVVLAHVAREALDGERPVGDTEHERVLVLRGPDRVGVAAQMR